MELGEQIFRLLSLKRDQYPQGHMERLVKSLSETIAEVNDAFIHTKIVTQAMLVNIISTHEDPAQRVSASEHGLMMHFKRRIEN